VEQDPRNKKLNEHIKPLEAAASPLKMQAVSGRVGKPKAPLTFDAIDMRLALGVAGALARRRPNSKNLGCATGNPARKELINRTQTSAQENAKGTRGAKKPRRRRQEGARAPGAMAGKGDLRSTSSTRRGVRVERSTGTAPKARRQSRQTQPEAE
jgi:hypothetical protein